MRFLKGLTIDDVHILTGRRISQPKISRIERDISIASEEEKTLISKALKKPVSEVFPEEEEVK